MKEDGFKGRGHWSKKGDDAYSEQCNILQYCPLYKTFLMLFHYVTVLISF